MENLTAPQESQQVGREESPGQDEDSRPDAHISEADRQHLQAFPRERKAALMERMLAREPDRTVELEGTHGFERTLRRLRRDGYALIDLQLHETAFSSVWYRKSDGALHHRRTEIAMVIWALQEQGPSTTVQSWWL